MQVALLAGWTKVHAWHVLGRMQQPSSTKSSSLLRCHPRAPHNIWGWHVWGRMQHPCSKQQRLSLGGVEGEGDGHLRGGHHIHGDLVARKHVKHLAVGRA